MTLDQRIPNLERIRRYLQALSASQPDDQRLACQLASVERSLSDRLSDARRFEDARIVLLGSLAKLDALVRHYPADPAVRAAVTYRLFQLSAVSKRLSKTEDCIRFLARAVQLLESGIRLAPTRGTLARLFEYRRLLARSLAGLGDYERALSLVAANRRLSEGTRLEGVNLSVDAFSITSTSS